MNIYPGKCDCGAKVPAYAGTRKAVHGDWKVFCSKCVPPKPVERRLTAECRIIMPYDPSNLNLVKSLPGSHWVSKYEGGPYWQVSTKISDRIRVLEIADLLKLDVDPILREDVKTNSNVQDAITYNLYPFQVDGVNWLSRQTKAILADDPGLGKTVQALVALELNDRVLIVCPAIMKSVWRELTLIWRPEFYAFEITKRDFRLPEAGEIVIISYDGLPENLDKTIIDQLGQVSLVLDELHKCKNRKTKRHKKIKTISRYVKKTWGLTGTPVENNPTELYGMLNSINLAYPCFGTWSSFYKLFNGYRNLFGGTGWGTPEPIVPELLKRYVLRRERQVVLPDLPEKTITYLGVGVDRHLFKEMDDAWEKHSAVFQRGELPPFGELSSLREKLSKSRIPAMLEYMEECEEQNIPLVVFTDHIAPLTAIYCRPGWEIIDGTVPVHERRRIVDRFQKGQLKGLGCTYKTCAEGIDLTYAYRGLCVDQNYNHNVNEQAESRLLRIGQKNAVEIVRMHSDHILDRHCLAITTRKIERNAKILTPQISPNIPDCLSEKIE